jgi:hypothetical protein
MNFAKVPSNVSFILLAILISLPFAAVAASAQNSKPDQGAGSETQTRGYWIDPSTGLMWAGKDNGRDVSWKKAMNYCRDLRLAGYSDWRLANIGELQGIFDKNAESPGENPKSKWHDAEPMTFHLKGNLFLTGNQWSSSQRMDDRGHPSGYVWYFNFNEGRPDNDPTGWPYGFVLMRALCVRGSGK